jgi:hypothetical protein
MTNEINSATIQSSVPSPQMEHLWNTTYRLLNASSSLLHHTAVANTIGIAFITVGALSLYYSQSEKTTEDKKTNNSSMFSRKTCFRAIAAGLGTIIVSTCAAYYFSRFYSQAAQEFGRF